MSSGVIDGLAGSSGIDRPPAAPRKAPRRSMFRSSLRRRNLLWHHLGAKGELAALDVDDRDPLLRDVGIGAERDRAGDALEILGLLERLLEGRGGGHVGALDRIGEE